MVIYVLGDRLCQILRFTEIFVKMEKRANFLYVPICFTKSGIGHMTVFLEGVIYKKWEISFNKFT